MKQKKTRAEVRFWCTPQVLGGTSGCKQSHATPEEQLSRRSTSLPAQRKENTALRFAGLTNANKSWQLVPFRKHMPEFSSWMEKQKIKVCIWHTIYPLISSVRELKILDCPWQLKNELQWAREIPVAHRPRRAISRAVVNGLH